MRVAHESLIVRLLLLGRVLSLALSLLSGVRVARLCEVLRLRLHVGCTVRRELTLTLTLSVGEVCRRRLPLSLPLRLLSVPRPRTLHSTAP